MQATCTYSHPDLEPPAHIICSIRTGDHAAFEQLLAAWDPILNSIAWRVGGRHNHRDDLCQAGRIALYRATMAYRPDMASFRTFATRTVSNAMRDELARVATRSALSLPLGDEEELSAVARPELERLVEQEDAARLCRWIRSLPERYQAIIDSLVCSGETQLTVARRLGITPARVSQILKLVRTMAAAQLN